MLQLPRRALHPLPFLNALADSCIVELPCFAPAKQDAGEQVRERSGHALPLQSRRALREVPRSGLCGACSSEINLQSQHCHIKLSSRQGRNATGTLGNMAITRDTAATHAKLGSNQRWHATGTLGNIAITRENTAKHLKVSRKRWSMRGRP